MKPEVLQLSPILIPEINARLDELFTVRRYFQQADKQAYLQEHGANIRGVITGGHTGISQALMAQLPKLEVVAVNGVGTDAVDLAYARDRRDRDHRRADRRCRRPGRRLVDCRVPGTVHQ
jgi:lactate dehydrogenase-like 2-hydroxyacid dehydrogenase